MITRRLAAAAALSSACLVSACGPETWIGVAATAGTAAMEERGFGAAVSDAAILTELNAQFFGRSAKMWAGLSVQVSEGRVLLSGKVREPRMRLDAVRIAWQANGVREVINEIEVTDRSVIGTLAQDTWISTKLKARITLDKDVSAINYTVVTVDSVIYLMGIAQNQTELDRVVNHARDIVDVRRVVSYVRLKDDPLRRAT